jgi:hypothetical protein
MFLVEELTYTQKEENQILCFPFVTILHNCNVLKYTHTHTRARARTHAHAHARAHAHTHIHILSCISGYVANNDGSGLDESIY